MDTSSEDSNSSFNYKINLIEHEHDLDNLLENILNDKNNPVIGVDCEAAIEMSRFGMLCLIQVTKI